MLSQNFYKAIKRFQEIEGMQWAAAFSYNVFFSLFPLIILFVTVASFFVDENMAAREVISYAERYIPLSGHMQEQIFGTLDHVVTSRRSASIIATIFLIWVALQCFTTLICATNYAWGTPIYTWWRLPIKSLALFCILVVGVVFGVALPSVMRMITGWFGELSFSVFVAFLSLSLFYKLAPSRHVTFSNVWFPAIVTALLLQMAAGLFVLYLKYFAMLNVIYGAFGGIMAFLLWIYLSGCIFIFGACLCAAKNKVKSHENE